MRRPDKEAGEDEEGEETTQSSTHDLEATFEAVQRGGAIESGSTTGSESEGSDDEDKGEGTWADPKHTQRLYAFAQEHHIEEHDEMIKALRVRQKAERKVRNVANETADKRRNRQAKHALLDSTMLFNKKQSKVLRLSWNSEMAQKAQRGKKRGPKPVVLPKPKAKQVLPQLH